VIPSVAATSASSPSMTVVKEGVDLTACNYASAKSFAHQLLQYLESLKNMEADREGNRFHSFNSSCNFVSFADFILHICVALSANLEATKKALAEERASQQIAEHVFQADQESSFTLIRDLQSVRASTDTLKEELEAARASATAAKQELSSKSAALDELVVRDSEAHIRLQTLGNEKKIKEHLLESTQKMLSERDYSSSVAHAVALLKSDAPDLDIELLHMDFPFADDEERDALIDSVYDTA
jgi:hypothetical protein